MPAKICALKVHPFIGKTKSWKNTAAVKLYTLSFRNWECGAIIQRKKSPFSVKHRKLKKVDMDRKEH